MSKCEFIGATELQEEFKLKKTCSLHTHNRVDVGNARARILRSRCRQFWKHKKRRGQKDPAGIFREKTRNSIKKKKAPLRPGKNGEGLSKNVVRY